MHGAQYPYAAALSYFFLRLRAIYNRNQVVVVTFFVLWIGLIVAALFVPLGITGGPVGPTLYCQYNVLHPVFLCRNHKGH